ncbi:MAG: DUF1573 domain-containing protein [Bacteroidales bacterium]|nr:DUF1573 domain-containing protein [Bacteroidales bacterium]
MKKVVLIMFCAVLNVALYAQHNKSSVQKAAGTQTEKAYFSLDTRQVSFGKLTVGNAKTMEVKFTNTGKKTLVLMDVYTNCGCTTVDWPRDPFAPGKSGVIKITYNPTEEGPFNKVVMIYTNASNKQEEIKIEGFVEEK